MSFGAVGGAVAATVVGSVLNKGAAAGGQSQGNSNFDAENTSTTTENMTGFTDASSSSNLLAQQTQQQEGGSNQVGGQTGTQQSFDNLTGRTGFGDFTGQTGMFGTQFSDGNLVQNMSPQALAMQQQGFGAFGNFTGQALNPSQNALMASQQGGQFLGGLNADPFDAQQQLFQQQLGMISGDQEQARLAQEGRLFAQGRLGGTEGSNQQNALLDAQAQERLGLFNNAFGQAQAMTGQNAQIGQNLAGFQGNQAGQAANTANQFGQGIFGLSNAQVQAGQLAGQFGPQFTDQQNAGSLDTTGTQFQDATNFQNMTADQAQQTENVSNTNTGSNTVSTTDEILKQRGVQTERARGPGIFNQIGTGLVGAGVNQLAGAASGLFQPNVDSPYSSAPTGAATINGYNIQSGR